LLLNKRVFVSLFPPILVQLIGGTSRPGKPTDNAFIEAFNSRFRQECLNTHWFLSLNDAIDKIEEWRRDYNYHRPHSAIGNITPIEFAMQQNNG
jgi:putative transposase